MAKIRAERRKGRGKGAKKLSSLVTVRRMGATNPYVMNVKNARFEACMRLGSGRRPTKGAQQFACAIGKNPRQAISRALKSMSKVVNSRSGAFAGFGKKKGY